MDLPPDLEQVSYESFLNVPRYFFLAWGAINFLKCCYICHSMSKSHFPSGVAAVMFAIAACVCFSRIQFLSYTLIFQRMGFLLMLGAALAARDPVFLLGLLCVSFSYVKPFDLIIDAFVISFLIIDYFITVHENPLIWAFLSVQLIGIFLATALLNSYGTSAKTIYANVLFLSFAGALFCATVNRTRPIPLFITLIFCCIIQFKRKEPIDIKSINSEFAKIPSKILGGDGF